jgi:hypothetical protein
MLLILSVWTVWLASVGQFYSPLAVAAFDMNYMVNSTHSENREYFPVTKKPVN